MDWDASEASEMMADEIADLRAFCNGAARSEAGERADLRMGADVDAFEVGDELIVSATVQHDGPELGTFLCAVTRRERERGLHSGRRRGNGP